MLESRGLKGGLDNTVNIAGWSSRNCLFRTGSTRTELNKGRCTYKGGGLMWLEWTLVICVMDKYRPL
jgi:hypothetical protein